LHLLVFTKIRVQLVCRNFRRAVGRNLFQISVAERQGAADFFIREKLGGHFIAFDNGFRLHNFRAAVQENFPVRLLIDCFLRANPGRLFVRDGDDFDARF
jgi:hypothetical protein